MEDELDELTLARARRGDPAAFRQLVLRYQRPVHAVIGRMLVGNASFAEVEELAQETFLRIYRALPDFSPEGPGRLTKWVVTIASRIAIDELRKRRPEHPMLPGDEPEAPQRADELSEQTRLASALERAVAALPSEQRAVFLLREYHDFEYEQIAEALELNLGTVKSRLARARAALREALIEVHRVTQG